MPRVRTRARRAVARSRLSRVLDLDSSPVAAVVRWMWRAAGDDRSRRPAEAGRHEDGSRRPGAGRHDEAVSPLPAPPIPHYAGQGGRGIRRAAAPRDSRAQVRGAARPRAVAGGPDARARRGRAPRRPAGGPGPPSLEAPPVAGLQPGGGSRPRPRAPRLSGARPRTANTTPIRPPAGGAGEECARSVPAALALAAAARRGDPGRLRRTGGRPCDDGFDVEGMCGRAEAARRPRGAGAYSRPSTDAAALATSAATASIGRSPSSATQPGCIAWRR
jgi:hypothetical protein